jgi:membrane protein YdbS with pleckstrin-like domain
MHPSPLPDEPRRQPSNAREPHPDDAPGAPLDDRARELDPRVVVGWRVSSAIWTAVVFGGATFAAVALLPVGDVLPIVVAVVLWLGWVAWYPAARLRRWRWRLTDLAIELRHGVVVHRHDAVPYFRIQQIDIRAGPVDRLLGIAQLAVTSASAAGSATLPGIPAEMAPELRKELLRRAEASLGNSVDEARDAV